MKLEYNSIIEESSFILTDFNCNPSKQLLTDKGYYKILWLQTKDEEINVDGYSIALKKNQVVFCTPVNVLDIPKNSGIVAIAFNREFYCIRDHDHEVSCNGLLFFGSSTPPIISLNLNNQKSFETMFHIFKEEFETKDHIQGEMLRVMLKRLLIKATRLIGDTTTKQNLSNSQAEIIRKYHILVENNFREKHQVTDYAEMLYKSPKTLSNLFKKNNNQSPLKIINDRIVLEAKRLLIFSNKTAEQISYELGYKEAGHFSKFFKSQTGLPPVTFKEKHKKNKGLR